MKRSTLRAVKKDESLTVPVEKGVTREEGSVGAWEATLPSVFDRMERMMSDMFRGELWGRFGTPWERLFHEIGPGGEGGMKIDMFEEGGTLVVKADLPGIAKEDLSVRIIEDNLVISGERRHEEKVERKDYLRVERKIGTFSRTIPLPEGANSEGIAATLKDGILDIRIPRIEVKKPVVHIDIA